jgi:hypothetical protein
MAPARGDLVDAGLVDAGLVDAGLVGAGSRLPITSATGQDVWLVTRTGRVFAYGDARAYGDAHASTPVVGAAVTPDGRGYWLVTEGGGVYSFGDAGRFGSLGGHHLTGPVVGLAPTADGEGYWLATAAGTVYGFGDAAGHGPGPGLAPAAGPVVGIVADPGTQGFWLTTAKGAVLGYSGAPTYRPAHLPAAVVAVAATPDGRGYWVVARDGRTATRGDAGKYGALNGAYSHPVVGMAIDPTGNGYWMATANGHVFSYGTAGAVASPPGSPTVVAILAASPAAGSPSLTAPTLGGLNITTTALPDLVAGQAYSAQLAASGGTAPYSWTEVGGALPPGLAMSAAGAISGTPDPGLSGTYGFTVQVTGSSVTSPRPATATFTIAVSSSPAASPALSQVPLSEVHSQNWSGYVATAGPYTAVSGSFTVPSLSPGTPAQDMVSEWVGIDGSDNTSLVQAGVSEVPDPYSTATFDVIAWWEVLPIASQPITTMTVSPGDEVSVTIAQVSGTSWTIHFTDATKGQGYTQDVGYTGPGTSAEWIVEAPTDSQTDQQIRLAPYSPAVTFSGLAATGSSAALSELAMVQEGQQVASPCALNPAGFSVAYGATAPSAP